MTAAAIATMATVEAATTTRPFYLVVPGRNRARLRARIDHLSFLATIWTPQCRSSTPVDISGLRRTARAGHSTRTLPTPDPSPGSSGRGDGRTGDGWTVTRRLVSESAATGREPFMTDTATPPEHDGEHQESSEDEGKQSQEQDSEERRQAADSDERTVTESGGYGSPDPRKEESP
jgi:hypothetical protein